MPGKFAAKTSVSIEKTRAEIEAVLGRYKATGFAYCRNDLNRQSMIEFIAVERRVRFVLTMPDPKSRGFTHNARGKMLVSSSQQANYDQSCRQRWRALLLAIKAKLEAVECGISEFESEFLANIVDPMTNRTVGEVMRPQIAQSYEGRPQTLLLTAAK